jgi:hypothetical protein
VYIIDLSHAEHSVQINDVDLEPGESVLLYDRDVFTICGRRFRWEYANNSLANTPTLKRDYQAKEDVPKDSPLLKLERDQIIAKYSARISKWKTKCKRKNQAIKDLQTELEGLKVEYAQSQGLKVDSLSFDELYTLLDKQKEVLSRIEQAIKKVSTFV